MPTSPSATLATRRTPVARLAPPHELRHPLPTEYRYDAPVTDNLNALRVRPATTATQRVDDFDVRVDPEARLHRHLDYFGTTVIEFGDLARRTTTSRSTSARACNDRDAGRAARDAPWERARGRAPTDAAGGRVPAARSAPSPDDVALDELVGLHRAPRRRWRRVRRLVELIPDRFEYRAGRDLRRLDGRRPARRPAPASARTSCTSRCCCCGATGSPPATSPATCGRRRTATRARLGRGRDPRVDRGAPARRRGEPVWVGADPTNRRSAARRT